MSYLTVMEFNTAKIKRLKYTGYFEDTSFDSEFKLKARNLIREKRRIAALNKIKAEFSDEIRQIKQLQLNLARKQRPGAQNVLEQYSALQIQAYYRGWYSRIQTKRFRAKLMIRYHVRHHLRYRRKIKSRRIIIRAIKAFRMRKFFGFMLAKQRAIVFMRRKMRNSILMKKTRHIAVCMKTAKTFFNHTLLFGMRRAMKSVCEAKTLVVESVRDAFETYIRNWHRLKRMKM